MILWELDSLPRGIMIDMEAETLPRGILQRGVELRLYQEA